MTRSQKLGYLVSEWVIAWFLFYAFVLFVVLSGSDDKMGWVPSLLGLGVVMFCPLVITRVVAIHKSKRRTGAIALFSDRTSSNAGTSASGRV